MSSKLTRSRQDFHALAASPPENKHERSNKIWLAVGIIIELRAQFAAGDPKFVSSRTSCRSGNFFGAKSCSSDAAGVSKQFPAKSSGSRLHPARARTIR